MSTQIHCCTSNVEAPRDVNIVKSRGVRAVHTERVRVATYRGPRGSASSELAPSVGSQQRSGTPRSAGTRSLLSKCH
jgi:hypothetical protein